MSQALQNIRRSNAATADKPAEAAGFPAMLEQYKGEIARALPKHINPDRMARIALTAFRMTPKLAECDPRSVFAAVIQSSQLGLEIGLMGEAHLVPFGNQCQLIPGYTGLMKLARNSGLVVDIYAEAVRINDKFALKLGMQRDLQHEPLTAQGGFPASDEERGAIVGFYAVGVLKDGSRTFVAMSRAEVEKIRDGSKGYQAAKKYKKDSPWDTDFGPMGKKTAIRRLCNWLPKSPELATALSLDDNAGRQHLNVDDAAAGVFTPVVDETTGEIVEVSGGTLSIQQQWDKYDEVLATYGKKEAENFMPKEPRPASKATEAKAEEASKAAAQGLVGKVVDALKKAETIEGLDEVYLHAESILSDSELESILVEYRTCKEAILKGKGGLFD
jgi:recombination protein RecT